MLKKYFLPSIFLAHISWARPKIQPIPQHHIEIKKKGRVSCEPNWLCHLNHVLILSPQTEVLSVTTKRSLELESFSYQLKVLQNKKACALLTHLYLDAPEIKGHFYERDKYRPILHPIFRELKSLSLKTKRNPFELFMNFPPAARISPHAARALPAPAICCKRFA